VQSISIIATVSPLTRMGTTISLRLSASHAIWPGNWRTSGTITVFWLAAAAANTLAEGDLLAGRFAVEGSQEKDLVFRRCVCGGDGYAGDALCAWEWRGGDRRSEGWEFIIADVEAGPVD